MLKQKQKIGKERKKAKTQTDRNRDKEIIYLGGKTTGVESEIEGIKKE